MSANVASRGSASVNATAPRSIVTDAGTVLPIIGLERGGHRALPPRAVLIAAADAAAAAPVVFPRSVAMRFADPTRSAMTVHVPV